MCAILAIVTPTIITVHDQGCRHAREDNGGHSDAAKRLSDTYNLHKTLGMRSGVIAISLNDGSSDDTVYPDRQTAIDHQRHNENWFGYIELIEPSMSVCQAAAVMRWQRITSRMNTARKGETDGGLIVIPRLTIEGREAQLHAIHTGRGLPIALGRKAR